MVKIIAEAAVNHLGSLELGKLTSKKAKEAGADFIKYQIMDVDELYAPGIYPYGDYNIDDVRKNRNDTRFSQEELNELFYYSSEIGIPATATPFGLKALAELIKLNPPFIKIASGDLNYFTLIEKAAESDIKLIISTGMSLIKDVEEMVNRLHKLNFSNFVLMHCISIYPHCENESQIGYISTLKNTFNCEVGFSDHTIGVAASSVAIALGATWIEKHFTLSKNLGGLDYKHSIEPESFANFTKILKGIEHSLTIKDRELFENEIYTSKRARRGLYSAREIQKGEVLTHNDFLYLRPENGIPISRVNDFIGKQLNRKLDKYQAFSYNDID